MPKYNDIEYLMEKTKRITEEEDFQDPFQGRQYKHWDDVAHRLYSAKEYLTSRGKFKKVGKEIEKIHDAIRKFDDPQGPFPDQNDFRTLRGEVENILKFLSRYEDEMNSDEKNGYRTLLPVYGFLGDIAGKAIEKPYEE